MTAFDTSHNIARFGGFAAYYDTHRPTPPGIIVDLLTQLARSEHPQVVVDIGSGTGLSTRLWAGRAQKIVGIEPNEDMRQQAMAATDPGLNIEYRAGLSSKTGLVDNSATIVTISQALHWLEPEPTLAEVARILQPGGVFAAYDCDWPPTAHWEAEKAYMTFVEKVKAIEVERNLSPHVVRWEKSKHLARIAASGHFRHVREVCLHHLETGDAERFVGVALSQGGAQTVLKAGISEEAMGLAELRQVAQRTIGNTPVRWFWTYRVRLAIK